MLNIHKCLRCGHDWASRMDRLPKVCPKCKSPYWNKPKWKGINEVMNMTVTPGTAKKEIVTYIPAMHAGIPREKQPGGR